MALSLFASRLRDLPPECSDSITPNFFHPCERNRKLLFSKSRNLSPFSTLSTMLEKSQKATQEEALIAKVTSSRIFPHHSRRADSAPEKDMFTLSLLHSKSFAGKRRTQTSNARSSKRDKKHVANGTCPYAEVSIQQILKIWLFCL